MEVIPAQAAQVTDGDAMKIGFSTKYGENGEGESRNRAFLIKSTPHFIT